MDNAHATHLAEKRMAEWISRQQAQKEEKSGLAGPVDWRTVVTISRQPGAGGHTVAQKVCQAMGPGWKVWDREIIDALAESVNMRREMIESLDENVHSWLEQVVRDVFGVTTMETFAYRRHLAQVLLSIAHQGNAVIVGRGANFLLKHGLNVRLRAGRDFRIKETMAGENMNREQAEKRVREIDKRRAEFTRSVFERDIDDIEAYDMILRTDILGFDVAAAAIVAATKAKISQQA
ncbi:MAG: cytidylate kinase-like family protein [Armatimonadetes bacterium]|nr:cytidylate kinase-like family protein [Armatimonadota bacterium]